MMKIYPAIDLKNGQCVRLVQGRADQKTIYSDTPADVARGFQKAGAAFLHIVDLDGAFQGRPQNHTVIKDIAAAIDIPFQVGGGLRTVEDVENALSLGAARVIIGTKAVSSPAFVAELLTRFGPDRIILGLDARDGMVAVEGWVNVGTTAAVEFGVQMKALGVSTAIYTDISRDGLLDGPNVQAIGDMAEMTGLQIIASGGVTTVNNILALKELESRGVVGAIIGKALYDGKLDLTVALAAAGLQG